MSTPTDTPAGWPVGAEPVFTRQDIDAALDRLAARLTADLADSHPVALTVLHGGLVFAGHLLPRLAFRLTTDYVHATRYRGAQRGSELVWIARPATALAGRTVLLLDDIYDEGFTLESLVDFCRDMGAARVVSAVLLRKHHHRPTAALQPDYHALEVDDRYVFGFGMDIHHEWRNANGIYAVPQSGGEAAA